MFETLKFKDKNKERRNKRLKNCKKELIVHNNPYSSVTEAYRQVRANLDFLNLGRKIKSLVITSSISNEGKSHILANIAIALAQNGKKILIIDADLRKPIQHRFFEMTNYEGLSNILSDKIDYKQGKRETFIKNVSLISAGIIPPNPTELLDSEKMDLVLETASCDVDMVLIDTPPVIPVSDSVLLSNKSDGVLLVVVSHKTPGSFFVKTYEALKKAQANVVGVILNKYQEEKAINFYRNYYYQR